MKKFIIILLLVMSACTNCFCAEDTATRIFSPRMRTLKAAVVDNFMSPPVIRIGTDDRLYIKFDEIGEDNSYLEYRLIHCNADWQPSRLSESEYVDGFNSARIEDYAFSRATYVHYVNYMITLPNDDMRIMHSGNYLLQVYDPDEPDETLLQCRFQVSENGANSFGSITSRTDMGHNSEWQQLAFTADFSALGNINPYQDLIVYVTQNDRADTRRIVRSPLRLNGQQAVYEHLNDLIFPASNEYRRFESTSNNFAGMHVDSLRFMGTNYHVWLKPDSERRDSEYSFDRTQHGRFIIREYNSTDSDLGADYITVHFLLNAEENPALELFVDGEFTHGLYDRTNRMTYDSAAGGYVLEIPLKQGAYNYQYVARPVGSVAAPSPSLIEGNKYETDNEYSVEVFYRPPGARGDRLVGFRTVTGM
ncbi:MAG: DUF5103 domain-containing protein [Muribaculaceae bacterium]|nr:DUF5103 domain-containing protein [Muribaculaceae bacterium]